MSRIRASKNQRTKPNTEHELTGRKMGIRQRSWLGTIKNKFARSPRNRVIAVQCNGKDNHVQTEIEAEKENPTTSEVGGSGSASLEGVLTEEDLAAIKIQAFFRGHLARQAFRALRSLVKLQALVRGVCARRQARIALHCMHTLVRLQVKVRVRQLLSKSDQDI